MPKAAVRLFRNPIAAAKAAEELKAQGFKAEEIGIMVHDGEKAKKLGTKVTKEIGVALTKLGLPEDTVRYYEFGASVGGVLISVQTDETRLAQAQQILRGTDLAEAPKKADMWASSPAFPAAGRMAATDPIDAKMTGDFRQY